MICIVHSDKVFMEFCDYTSMMRECSPRGNKRRLQGQILNQFCVINADLKDPDSGDKVLTNLGIRIRSLYCRFFEMAATWTTF